MALSLAQVYIHLIFHTKYNLPFINDGIENEMYAYIGGIIKASKGKPISINGTKDHIHVLASLPRTMSLANFVEEIKRSSSLWIKTKGWQFQKFAWQNGYAAFSVSQLELSDIIKVIRSQKKYHTKISFREEYIRLLEYYEVEYNQVYLWA